jgi:hypothetical protein
MGMYLANASLLVAAFVLLICIFWVPNRDPEPQVRRGQLTLSMVALIALARVVKGPTEMGDLLPILIVVIAIVVPGFRRNSPPRSAGSHPP